MASDLGIVSLDLDRIVAEGLIDEATARQLHDQRETARGTSALVSVLYIIGALAAAAGVVLLKPTATTGLLIAIVCLIAGQLVMHKGGKGLSILALALGIGATSGLCGWFALEFGEDLPGWTVHLFGTTVTLVMAVLFRSRFLAALVPLGIGAMTGSDGAYWHASYGIFVREAFITAVLFSVLAGGLWWLSESWRKAEFSAMARIAARMSFIIANFGLWVGSLWGDYVGEHFSVGERLRGQPWGDWRDAQKAFQEQAFYINEHVFALAWAVFALVAVALGRNLNNRFLEVAGIAFFAINAFTQYFEYFKAEPFALIFGGIAMVAIALLLVRWQIQRETDAA